MEQKKSSKSLKKLKKTSSKEQRKIPKHQANTNIIRTVKTDTITGEIVETGEKLEYKEKRAKGTFAICTPEEQIKILKMSNKRAINNMLCYIIEVVNTKNEFAFSKNFIANYSKKYSKQRFYTDRKYLIVNKYIAPTERKNIYVLYPQFYCRCSPNVCRYILNKYFNEEYDMDSKQHLQKILKAQVNMTEEDIITAINALTQNLKDKRLHSDDIIYLGDGK